jgi:hypothetical protein
MTARFPDLVVAGDRASGERPDLFDRGREGRDGTADW